MTSEATEDRTFTELTVGPGRGPGGRLTASREHAPCCPIPGCGDHMDPSRLMCRCHWYRVPKQLRDQPSLPGSRPRTKRKRDPRCHLWACRRLRIHVPG